MVVKSSYKSLNAKKVACLQRGPAQETKNDNGIFNFKCLIDKLDINSVGSVTSLSDARALCVEKKKVPNEGFNLKVESSPGLRAHLWTWGRR
jgi:hypothetical protein